MKQLLLAILCMATIQLSAQKNADTSTRIKVFGGGVAIKWESIRQDMPQIRFTSDSLIKLINIDSAQALKKLWLYADKIELDHEIKEGKMIDNYNKLVKDYNLLLNAYLKERRETRKMIDDLIKLTSRTKTL